jgi:hypothetical protein
MSKRRASGTVADQIAKFIGKTMGDLVNRKESLQRQLADVDRQIAGVRKRVLKQFGGSQAAKRRVKRAAKSAARAVRRELSPETRKKMAASAKKRWAKVRQAAKDAAGS